MPPLDHPALLYSREKTTTYPPRARAKGTKDDDGVAPDQFTFGRALRPHRSLPRVQQLFGTRPNKGGDEGNEQGDNAFAADDSAGDKGGVPVPTIGLGCITRPINDLTLSLSPPTQTFPSSLSSSSNLISPSASVGPVDAYDPIASNLYDLNISLSGNAVRMQQNAPRVRDKKPLRSSLKASARPTPIASTSSSNPSALMPSISLVAGGATASDGVSPQTPVSSPGRSETARGKRKAEDVDITPPDSKKATFAVPASPRDQTSALAPSSYHDNKRARLSGPSPSPAPPNSNAQNIGTYSSLASSRAPSRTRAPSSTRSATAGGGGLPDNTSERERRGSLSQRSIPISALVTPQVPSVGRTSSAYHMRDPRRPPRRMETSWALRFRTADDAGSPVQSWLFYLALVLFPLWWIGAVWRVPKTRVVGGTDTEKAVPLDDPQIEFDARSWRFRCRVMAVISLFTYVPFIVCIAVFGGR
ncbi:hypothetical protein F5148DRAFT_667823 [Russula earlei]|uniref:Uncharacterized protein n=1 Tax=Russula earlei TaxID=71964 RepID=A0ACC0UEK3_9AGAM|nr:hypothetical protein F5148DRAFT_667823 [Russula earlei]